VSLPWVLHFPPLSNIVCSARMGQLGVTVCWYYRPEQTIHPPHRQFWEGEVFKTSCSSPRRPLTSAERIYRSLRRSPSGRYHRNDRLPIYCSSHPWQTTSTCLVSWIPSLCVRLAVQRPRAYLRQDQKLEFMRTGRSSEECRFYADLSLRGAGVSQEVPESILDWRTWYGWVGRERGES